MDHSAFICLDKIGCLYTILGDQLVQYIPTDGNDIDVLLKSFQASPYQLFFKHPFTGIAYAVGDKIIENFKTHPSSFYPGSPFDVFEVVKTYLAKNQLIIPRFYLYPSSTCNARCPICQFNFRRKNPTYLRWDVIKKTFTYMACQQSKPKKLSVIISGDGEPTLHPDFIKILEYCAESQINIFLTSNWILPPKTRDRIIDKIAQHVSMLTISLKGLNSISYHHYQGIDSSQNIFNRVLKNLEILLERLEQLGRRNEVLIGIASLILPENTLSYRKMIEYFVANKLAYVYLNVVEPSYEQWGITFTEMEQQQTLETLKSLKDYRNCGTLIRFPENPFKTRYNYSVYYDADQRSVKHLCGSALWNPIVIPRNHDDGIFLSCRSSEHFDNENFWYSGSVANEDFQSMISRDRISKVMAATTSCHQCRLERQVRLFDNLLKTEIENNLKGTFLLTFNKEKLGKNNGAITFEETL